MTTYNTIEEMKTYIKEVISKLKTTVKVKKTEGGKVRIQYIEAACSMDIETSSFINDEQEKVALMYTNQWQVEDGFILLRTWEEARELMEMLRDELQLGPLKKLIFYVHNLQYEFQFFRKEFEVSELFAVDDRKPLYVECNGIVFKDSLILANKSLEKVGKDVGIAKLKGDFDYKKIRTPETPLTELEIEYCKHDTAIVVEYIRGKMKEEKSIVNIPMTNTGYVRRHIREKCKENYAEHSRLMKALTLTTSEYKMLKQAFAGGFTHANADYVGKEINETMESQDFSSSYPAVMVSEKFPMSKGKRVKIYDIEEIEMYKGQYAFLIDIVFTEIRRKDGVPDDIISESKCTELSTSNIINNGRVHYANRLRTTITEVDLEMIKKFYDFEEYDIKKVICYRLDYLPKPIVRAIWDLYKEKTKLKDVEEKIIEYMISKGMLNACFGMIVTDIVRDSIEYEEDEWTIQRVDITDTILIEEQIKKYNESKSRFLFYPWGVWVTAYARRNLLEGILEAGEDFVYADTDSRKILHPERHTEYVKEYNEGIKEKVKKCLLYAGIEYEEPEDIKGVKHPIGIWDYDGTYARFKTLGAKRYLYETEKGKTGFTVAGIPKSAGIAYIEKNGWTKFDFGMELTKEESGKMVHTYIDDERAGIVRDYTGREYEYETKTGLHLDDTTATITLSKNFQKFLLNLEK